MDLPFRNMNFVLLVVGIVVVIATYRWVLWLSGVIIVPHQMWLSTFGG